MSRATYVVANVRHKVLHARWTPIEEACCCFDVLVQFVNLCGINTKSLLLINFNFFLPALYHSMCRHSHHWNDYQEWDVDTIRLKLSRQFDWVVLVVHYRRNSLSWLHCFLVHVYKFHTRYTFSPCKYFHFHVHSTTELDLTSTSRRRCRTSRASKKKWELS